MNRAERRKRISDNRKPGKLDAYNEALASRGLFLHPTKGYRKLSFRRFLIASKTQAMMRGEGDLQHVFQAAQAYKRARKRAQNPEVSSTHREASQGPQELQKEAAE
jgi:hypothetical protein